MPIAELGVSASLKLAADRIGASLKYAQERARNNVEALKAFSDAARDAIIALEAEYDDILVDAEFCDLRSGDQITSLQQRIAHYLRVDLVLPHLESAAQGLRRMRNLLQDDAQGFFKELWYPDRLAAVAGLTNAVESLENYIYKLEHKLDHKPDGRTTGVGMDNLFQISCILQRAKQTHDQVKADTLESLVKHIRRSRSKDGLVLSRDSIEKAYFDILCAF